MTAIVAITCDLPTEELSPISKRLRESGLFLEVTPRPAFDELVVRFEAGEAGAEVAIAAGISIINCMLDQAPHLPGITTYQGRLEATGLRLVT